MTKSNPTRPPRTRLASTSLRAIVPEKSPRLREAAYASIKEAILAGRIASGQPLMEETIADLLGISRTPVREALALLEHDELISMRSGRGLSVRKLPRREFLDMFAANEVIEPHLARLAAAHASTKQVEEMHEVIGRCSSTASNSDLARFLSTGREFHRLLGECAGNEILRRFVVRNEERTDLYLLGNAKALDAPAMEASVREHSAIAEAIASHDAEAAARLAIFHSQSIRHRLAPLFGEDGGQEDDSDEEERAS
jgi:DNA-binding GntR family transcriptional regulator